MNSKEQYMQDYPVVELTEYDYEMERRKQAIQEHEAWLSKVSDNGRQWAALMQGGHSKRYFKSATEMDNFCMDGLKFQGDGFDVELGLWYIIYDVVDYMAAKENISTNDPKFCHQETGAYPARDMKLRKLEW